MSRRRLLAVATAGALLVACGQGSGSYVSSAPPEKSDAIPAPLITTYQSSGPAKTADKLTLPLRLIIPRIGVNAPVVAVGLTRDGAMDAPQRAEDVGWYEYGPRPGMKGNAVLAGHLNWYGVDGVFRRLADLKQSDTVVVRAADGEERTYAIDWTREFPVNNAPMEQVFERVEAPALTLITCGGAWNPLHQRYDTRVVVRAARA